jgi:hypothetical protein
MNAIRLRVNTVSLSTSISLLALLLSACGNSHIDEANPFTTSGNENNIAVKDAQANIDERGDTGSVVDANDARVNANVPGYDGNADGANDARVDVDGQIESGNDAENDDGQVDATVQGEAVTFEIVNTGAKTIYLNSSEPQLFAGDRLIRIDQGCEYCLCDECSHCAICGLSNRPNYVITLQPGSSVSFTWNGIEWIILDRDCTCITPQSFSGDVTVHVVYDYSYVDGPSPWGDEKIIWQYLVDPKTAELSYNHPTSDVIRIEIQ